MATLVTTASPLGGGGDTTLGTPFVRKRAWPRSRVLVAGAAGLAALGFFVASALNSGAVYYLTVGELYARRAEVGAQRVRVAGRVVPGTIERAGGVLRFSAFDPATDQRLPITYRGVVPDAFNEEAEVVVEGTLGSDGAFSASTLLAKCPSKYEEAA